MTAARSASAKPRAVSPKLMIVLGVVFVLTLGMHFLPHGGGSAAAPLRVPSTFHHRVVSSTSQTGATPPGATSGAGARDPFGPPPGYTTAGH